MEFLFEKMMQKEIVLLPYPFSDMKGKKVRPALVVSNNNFNVRSNDCIMVPLTSVIKDEPHSILIDQDDLASGKLHSISRVKADKIFTVEKKIAIMKIGILNDGPFEKIRSEILKIL